MPPLRLEVFETAAKSSSETVITDLGAMEEERLAAYEQGYTAGWDDAAAAQTDEEARMSADLAHNLQSLGFTYHEARVHVLKAIAPLLTELTERLLPEMAKASLATMVLETLMPLAESMADAPVEIVLNPAARPAVEAVLEKATGFPLTVTEEPTLGEGQVYLRLGHAETRVDLDGAIAEIAAALKDFFEISTKDQTHG
jgi:flagellar biosynthesis/type III secretory pathway protein FliH